MGGGISWKEQAVNAPPPLSQLVKGGAVAFCYDYKKHTTSFFILFLNHQLTSDVKLQSWSYTNFHVSLKFSKLSINAKLVVRLQLFVVFMYLLTSILVLLYLDTLVTSENNV